MSTDVALIYGGRSVEHDWSVAMLENTMHTVKNNRTHDFSIRKVLYISLDGELVIYDVDGNFSHEDILRDGERTNIQKIGEILTSLDCFVFSLLQGRDGEDGTIQGVGALLEVPSSFGSIAGAAMSQDKALMSELAAAVCKDLKKIPYLRLPTSSPEGVVQAINERFGSGEIVVKPNSLGGSFCTRRFLASDHRLIAEHVRTTSYFDRFCLGQQMIHGKEVACGVIVQNGEPTALPPAWIRTEHGFLGSEEKKRTNGFAVDFELEDCFALRLRNIAEKVARSSRVDNFCRMDFIIDDEGQIFFLENNILPGLTRGNIFPQMLQQVGMSISDLIKICICNQKDVQAQAPYRVSNDGS
ncbi:hypothetical protein [Salinarimonas ramus]|uniref:hypothetical protein n=1 Tax=Salinarimonas ramus TaxID=690164 RepID=UPI00166873FB|nr:hypothetical protein [Salinarimonas ramus]